MPRINNKKFYLSAINLYGLDAKGVNWKSKESQYTRFEIICKLLPNNLNNFSIVDAGCGFGDFYNYLNEKNNLPKKYVGIDILDKMCKIARKRTLAKIITANICKDKLVEADFYICSGAMNILSDFETHLFIRNSYKYSKIGFIFNILYGDKKSETYNYMTKDKLKLLAKSLDVKRVIIEDDYINNDITVGFFK